MKVSVDKDECTGCGLCADDCPDVFEMGDEIAEVKVDEVSPELADAAREAAENCPVEAISVEE